MSSSVPSYLRLHLGDDSKRARPQLTATDQFWSAFSAATGWRVDQRHHQEDVQVLPAVEQDLLSGDGPDMLPPVVKENATELASLARAMAQEIEQLECQLRRQEIELAAQTTAELKPSHVCEASELVHQSLQRAIDALGFDAAAIYMLDDETQYLRTRAVVGLPSDRLAGEPRMLRGSRADLEAMVQDAVLMEDLLGQASELWNPPEHCGAAVCTSLCRGDLPIGTLWLFSKQPTQLGKNAVAIAQLLSDQITLQLSTAADARSGERHKQSTEAINELAAWQYSALPVGNHLAPGWFVDGMIESPNDWSVGWHVWDVLPDGSLMFAIAEADQRCASGAMVAATARAALAAHSGYRHTPRQILQRIGDTLWQTNSADQLVSLLYARIDPETGEGEIASAGNLSGVIAGKHGYRPLIQSGSRPLASSIEVECFETTVHLATGESLLACGTGVQADGIGQDLLGSCLRSAARHDQSPLAVLRREMASFPNRHERGLMLVSRRSD